MTARIDKSKLSSYLVLASAATVLTALGIIFKQDPRNILPLYISLCVALLQSRISRFAPLLGGLNSILYAIFYFTNSLYASAGYAILVSFPLQIATFIRWSRNRDKEKVILRRLSGKSRVLIAAGFVLCWIALWFALRSSGAQYLALDNTVTLLGILTTVLMMLSYVEYTVLIIAGNLCSIALYIAMIAADPRQVTYLFFTCYSLGCNIVALLLARKRRAFETPEK